MTVTTGPNIGLLINAEIGEEYYAALTSFLRGVDGLIQPRVGDKDLSAPPSALSNGVMYIVGANPTGAWAGKAGQLARWFSVGAGSPAWEFYVPKLGWSVRVLDELDSNGVAKEYVYGSAGWVVPAGGSGGGGVAETYTPITPSGGALNLSNPATTIWGVNLNANVATVTLPSNLSAPTGITLIITQDSTGGRTITWPSNVTWNGAAPTIKSTANGKTMLGLLTVDGGATWLGTSIPTSSGSGSGMVNPMTAKGSLIVGGTAGAAEELLVGAAGQVLTVSSSGTLVWTTPSGGGGGGDFKSDGSVRMTGPVNEAPAVTLNVTTGSTASIYPVAGNTVSLNSTGNIESFGEAPAGVTRRIYFQNSMTLKRSSILETLTNGDIVTRLGDWAEMYSNGGGFWVMMSYTKKDGTPLVAPTGGGDFKADGSVPMTGAITLAAEKDLNIVAGTIAYNLAAIASNNIRVTGAGYLDSLGTAPAGTIRTLRFSPSGTLIISDASYTQMPGTGDVTVAEGDTAQFRAIDSNGTWKCLWYTRADGTPIKAAADTSALDLAGTRTMTGPVNEAPIQDVRSYSTSQPTTNLVVTQSNVLNLIYWDASITSFGTAPKGFRRTIVRTGYTGSDAGQDTGPITLVHNATSLRLPGGANITTSIGDSFEVVSLGGGNWFVEWYQKANGRALVADGFTEDQVRATRLTGLVAATGDVVATDSILAALGKLQATKVAKVDGKGLSTNDYTADDKSKLANIQANATANSLDSFLLARANHTGTQVISTINGLPEALNSKVDIVAGKGLSTNDYTNTDQSKLAAIQNNATANSLDSFLLARANHTGTQAISTVSGLQAALDAKAPLASPSFTGPVTSVLSQNAFRAQAPDGQPQTGFSLFIPSAPADRKTFEWLALNDNNPRVVFRTINDAYSAGTEFIAAYRSATSYTMERMSIKGVNLVVGQDAQIDSAFRLQSAGPVYATSYLTVKGTSGEPRVIVDGPNGSNRYVRLDTAGSQRWQFGVNGASESGSNAGSDFYINRFGDDGTALGNTLTVGRASGDIALWGRVQTTGPFKTASYTLTTLPSAAANNGYMILVSNATGGPKYCVSNGNVWQIMNTGNTVS